MKNLTEQLSRERLKLMTGDDVYPVATIGEVQALARIALAQQDASGKIYQIRKTDGSEEWEEWSEVSEWDYHADVSNDGWERRILYTAPVAGVPDGWKLVPVEPAWQMIDAAIKHHEGEAFLPVSLYKAMLAAAPVPGGSDAN